MGFSSFCSLACSRPPLVSTSTGLVGTWSFWYWVDFLIISCAQSGKAEALDCALITPVEAGAQFHVGSLEIMPFRTWHDAEEPLGFLVHGVSGIGWTS